jgi:hypothetical protein
MRLALENESAIIISHGLEREVFPISGTNSYEKTKLTKIIEDDEGNPYDPFKNINDFILTLGRRKQQELFDVYVQVSESFIDILPLEELKTQLQNAFTSIFDIVSVDEVEEWMTKYDLVHIPTQIEQNEFSHYKSERTYTPEKYKGLIALSVALKLAVPIWGAYVKYITKGFGVGRKEIHCIQLLSNSTIVNSNQYIDFNSFIVSTHEVGKFKIDTILTGVGTEEQATLIPAACLFRKIAIAPNLKSKSAVTEAYNYVVNDGPSHERKHPHIRAKKIERGGVGEIEEQALLETFKTKESISAGDIAFIAYCCEFIGLNLKSIVGEVPPEWVKEAENLRDYLIKEKFDSNIMNLRLLQWFVPGAPPQIITRLKSNDIYTLMAHVGVVNPDQYREYPIESLLATLFTALVYMGYPQIALMVTAVISDEEIDTSIGNSRKQIPAELDAALDDLYPIRVSGGKDSINMVKEAISRYFNAYSGRSYRSLYTPFFKQYVEQLEDREGNHYLRPETPILLAKITLDIYGERKNA